MIYALKYRFFCVVIILSITISKGFGQVNSYPIEYNFKDFSSTAFTVDSFDISPSATNPLDNQAFMTAVEVSSLASNFMRSNPDTSESATVIENKFKVWKVRYSDELYPNIPEGNHLNALVIRPNDDVVRPCVFVSLGDNGDITNGIHIFSSGAIEFAARGYTAILYDNPNAKKFNRDTLSTLFPQVDFQKQIEEFDFAALQHTLFARAIIKYAVGNKIEFNINTDFLFSYGHSAGGLSTFGGGFIPNQENSTPNAAFSDPYFSLMFSNLDDYVLSAFESETYDIKCVSILGSGYPDPVVGKMKEIFTSTTSDKVVAIVHGTKDREIGNVYGARPLASLQGPLYLKNKFDSLGIVSHILFHCEGNHGSNYIDNTDSTYGPIGLVQIYRANPFFLDGFTFDNADLSSNFEPNDTGQRDIERQLYYLWHQNTDNYGFFAKTFEEIVTEGNLTSKILDQQPIARYPEELTLARPELGSLDNLDGDCAPDINLNCRSLSFNGHQEDLAIVPSSTSFDFGAEDFTIEASIKVEPTETGLSQIIGNQHRDSITNTLHGFFFGIDSTGVLTFNVDGIQEVKGNTFLRDGLCHHVAVVKKENAFIVYVDLMQEALDHFENIANFGIKTTFIGFNNSEYIKDWPFFGHMDYLRVWTIERTNQLNEEISGGESNLLAAWEFNGAGSQQIAPGLNNEHPIILGRNSYATSDDPNWMLNDVSCECFAQATVVGVGDYLNFESSNFAVYPNPSQGQVNIQYRLLKDSKLSLDLIGLNGKVIKTFQEEISKSSGFYNDNLNLHPVGSGLYLVRVIIDNKEVIVKKVIVL